MPLRTVTFVANEYYHVYNRGSEKRTIFQSPRDYNNFLQRVKENSQKFSAEILCYCLMPNHYHFLIRQNTDLSIAKFMNAIQLGYAKYFNTKYERVGPLFQGRFKAKLIGTDEYLLHLSAYIHRNPIADTRDSGNPEDSRNLIKRLHVYPYSSYREYLRMVTVKVSKPNTVLEYFSKTNPRLTYQSFVEGFIPDYEALAPLLANS